MAEKTEHIKALVDLMNTKLSFTLENYLTKSNEVIIYENPIKLNPDRHYEAALIYLDVYNSLKNITEANNKFYYAKTQTATPTWKTITFTPGAYQITDINSYIQLRKRTNEALAAGALDPITLTANLTTNRADIQIVNGYSIDFSQPNTLKDMFGFDPITTKTTGTTSGARSIRIVSFNAIVINTDLTKNAFRNGKLSPAIHSYSAFKVPTGYKMFEIPNPPIYLLVKSTTNIDSVRIWITDENGNPLDFDGEVITVKIHIRQI